MARWIAVGSVAASLLFCAGAGVRAESRPIKELPDDVARWSTVWGEIPAQMYEVGIDHGPMAALTWGPAKGAVVMVESVGKEVWHAATPEKRPGHYAPSEKGVSGAIFRYEF